MSPDADRPDPGGQGVEPGPDQPGPGGEDLRRWHRLHPLSPLVRAGRSLIAVVVVAAPNILPGHRQSGPGVYIDLGLFALLVVLGVVSWLVTRWRVEGASLRIDSGLVRRSSRRFPLGQLQAVDTVRPLLARMFGLAELRLRMAGSTGSAGRLAYLTDRDAEALRARLLALAHGVAENAPAPPERVLLSVPTGRLVGSILLSGLGVILETMIVGVVVLAALDPAAAGAAIGGSAALFLGLLTAFWRRFNSQYALTAAEAPDGLRLRSGLLETTAETIPRGRVQAMRLVEPLLWRPFGWCRLEVDVAGKQRGKRENQSESRQLRALLPVGSRDQARWLLDRVLPSVPGHLVAPPSRARLKAPLSYHNLAWTHDDTYAVTRSGRLRRTTCWVPLAKVQSIRRVDGPLQRALGLSTVHLDTAGRNVHAAVRDRDRAEADSAVPALAELCRAARQGQEAARRLLPAAVGPALPPRPRR